MAITEKQREASRINGARSRGPRTESGRRASARNSTKHGMSGKGDILPDGMDAEVAAELEVFTRRFHPVEHYETRLVEQAALAQVRKNRLLRAELCWTADRVRMALERHDEARAAEVRELAGLLLDDPAAALEGLRRSTEGCDWLADTWDDLASDLARSPAWDDDQARIALALLGHVRPPDAARDPEAAHAYRQMYVLRIHADPAGMAQRLNRNPADLLAGLPTRAEALDALKAFVAGQIHALELRAAELWERRDRPRRDAAPDLALFDPGPEFAKLIRYLGDADRQQRRALAELDRLRRQQDRARREPDPPPYRPPAPGNGPATAAPSTSPLPATPPAAPPSSATATRPEPRPASAAATPPADPTAPHAASMTPDAVGPEPSRNEPGAPEPRPRL